MDTTSLNNYKNKINMLILHFGISESAAKYIFHRRRRGYPFKKEGEENYLQWSMQLQNAFIEADKCSDIKWSKLKFKDDLQVLTDKNIDIKKQSKAVVFSKVKQVTDTNLTRKGKPSNYDKDLTTSDTDEWTVITNNKSGTDDKQLLRKMGFVPRS